MISLAFALPLKHAVAAQTAVVVTALASLPAVQRLSFALCAESARRYQAAAEALTLATASILPHPLGAAVQQQHQRLGTASFSAIHGMGHLLLSYGLLLAILHRWELQRRLEFARQHRMAAAARELVRRRQRRLGTALVVLCCAIAWGASCALLAAR